MDVNTHQYETLIDFKIVSVYTKDTPLFSVWTNSALNCEPNFLHSDWYLENNDYFKNFKKKDIKNRLGIKWLKKE